MKGKKCKIGNQPKRYKKPIYIWPCGASLRAVTRDGTFETPATAVGT